MIGDNREARMSQQVMATLEDTVFDGLGFELDSCPVLFCSWIFDLERWSSAMASEVGRSPRPDRIRGRCDPSGQVAFKSPVGHAQGLDARGFRIRHSSVRHGRLHFTQNWSIRCTGTQPFHGFSEQLRHINFRE